MHVTDIVPLFITPSAFGSPLRSLPWLTSNIPSYLTGFLKSRIRPESSKKAQESARFSHAIRAFTISAFTKIAAYGKETFR
jgi:hypothetical protein